MKPNDDTVRILGAYAEAVSTAADPTEAFRAAEDATKRLIGHRLFTIMQFNPDTMEVRRRYSSNPDDYPPGGRKAKRDTGWGRHVLEQGRVFIGYNADDIRNNFDDHEVIERLGLASVLNMPIRNLGRTIGTMNLLDVAGYYSEKNIPVASIIAGALTASMLMLNMREEQH